MSGWGAETVTILDVLERVSLPLTREHPDVQEKIGVFINDGTMYRDFWAAVIHGDMQAPPTAEGLSFREEFFHWRDNASGLAESHMSLVREAEAKERVERQFIDAIENPETRGMVEAAGQMSKTMHQAMAEGWEPGQPPAPDESRPATIMEASGMPMKRDAVPPRNATPGANGMKAISGILGILAICVALNAIDERFAFNRSIHGGEFIFVNLLISAVLGFASYLFWDTARRRRGGDGGTRKKKNETRDE